MFFEGLVKLFREKPGTDSPEPYTCIENELATAEDKYRSLVEQSIAGIYVIQDGIFVYVNTKLEEIFGYAPGEVAGKLSPLDLTAPHDRARVIENIRLRLEGEKDAIHYDFIGIHKNGTLLDIEVHGTRSTYGGRPAILGTLNDVSDRKRSELAIRESHRVIETLMSNLLGLAYRTIIKPDWPVEFVSEGCAELTGYSAADFMLGKIKWADLVFPEDREESGRELRKAIDEKRPYRFTCRIRMASGAEKWVVDRGRPILDATGKPIALEGLITDTTERMLAGMALKASEERLRLALDASDVGIWDWNILTGGLTWTERVAKLFGMSMDDFGGNMESWVKMLHPDDKERVGAAIDLTVRENARYAIDFRVVQPSGNVRWISAKGEVWRDSRGTPYRMMGSVVDNTDRIAAADELRDAKDRAEAANRLKSAIFANMSHEIRTPMTAILGYSEILMRQLKGSEMEKEAQVIYRGGNRLLHLLNSIIDIARVESGNFELQPVAHPVAETIERVVGLLKVLAKQKSLPIHIASSSDIWVATDTHAEEQILTNVLGNAIRFTEKGSITITTSIKHWGAAPMAVVEVIDTGVGISREFLPNIFEEFRQESEGHGRKHEGSGLGLSITKRLIEKMGGSIKIHSEKGAGCTVILAFPLASNATLPGYVSVEKKENEPTQQHHTILVVEDEPACGRLIERLLSGLHKTVWCANADDAERLARETRFDLVLMDINLKSYTTDGVQAMKRLRSLRGYEKVRIVALTAYAMKGDRERFIAEGFDDYVSKPFDAKTLLEIVNEIPPPK